MSIKILDGGSPNEFQSGFTSVAAECFLPGDSSAVQTTYFHAPCGSNALKIESGVNELQAVKAKTYKHGDGQSDSYDDHASRTGPRLAGAEEPST